MQKQDYDVIIIGAGAGGLISGNFLAQNNHRVLICERHCKPGGYLHGFKRRGFYFDNGCQSFSSSGVLFPLLKKLDLFDETRFSHSDFRLITPGLRAPLSSITAATRAFTRAFPQETASIESFFRELDGLITAVAISTKRQTSLLENDRTKARTMLDWLPRLGNLRRAGKYEKLLATEIIDKHFTDETLRALFSQLGDRNMSAFCLGDMWHSWFHDYWYPMGGMQALSNRLTDNFIEHGGDMRFRTEVKQIIVEKGRARGIVTGEGEEIYAPYVISAGDYKQAFTRLIEGKHLSPSWLEKIKAAPVSETVATVYLGIDYAPEEMREFMEAQRVLYYPSCKPVNLDDASNSHFYEKCNLSISVPSLCDRSLAPIGQSSVVLQSPATYDWQKKWRAGKNNNRTQSYRRLKEKVADQMIATADDIIPGLAARIQVIDVATPLTHELFTGNSGGASTGWNRDPRLSFIQKKEGEFATPIENLYAVGHWTFSRGSVAAAALSGKIVADTIASRLS